MDNIQNYRMQKVMEKQGSLRKDTTRLHTLSHLVQSAVELKIEIDNQVKVPSLIDEGKVAYDCSLDYYDENKAGEIAFRYLYGNIASAANAALILLQHNFISEPRQLWRNMCESSAIIYFLKQQSNQNNSINQAYLCHSFLTSWYKRMCEYNQLCKSEGKDLCYKAEVIDNIEEMLAQRFGEKGWKHDYAWTQLRGQKPIGLEKLIREANRKWVIWYRETCKEVHPTVGEKVVLTDFRDPLPFIPLLPLNHIFTVEQMRLEYWIAEVLKKAVGHTRDFLKSHPTVLNKATTTFSIAEQTLEELSR